MPGSATKAITLLVERKSGYEDPVDRLGSNLGQVVAWFRNSQHSGT
jgi:hypothetical protein